MPRDATASSRACRITLRSSPKSLHRSLNEINPVHPVFGDRCIPSRNRRRASRSIRRRKIRAARPGDPLVRFAGRTSARGEQG
jgi:hypothetical protein